MFMKVKLSGANDSESVDYVLCYSTAKKTFFCKMYICKCTSMIFIAFYDSIDTDVYFKTKSNPLQFNKSIVK